MQPTTSARFAAFGPRNYRLMWLGLVVLAAGFITMTLDSADYGEGFLGITLGPILLVIGFIVEFFAIMLRDPAVVASATPGAATAGASAPVNIAMSDVVPAAPAPVPTPRPTYKPL
ncbi:DUF3098 domain-containing protein [uncultured Hymenobacter sp.]|uniref:DUF3098 domain-containing protein n=1 Tax=uncultured Hymenobacter sp. TaxID=170016 RepID=UPI0035CC77C0